MPTYRVKDPFSGRTVVLDGPEPPTEQELDDVFDVVAARDFIDFADRGPTRTAQTTAGGLPVAFAPPGVAMGEITEELTRPRITTPKLPGTDVVSETRVENLIKRLPGMGSFKAMDDAFGKGTAATAIRTGINNLAGAAEFLSSDIGIGAAVGGAVAPTATAAGFALTMGKDAIEQARQLYGEWKALNADQRKERIMQLLSTGAMTALPAAHVVKAVRPKTQPVPPIIPPPVIPEAPPVIKAEIAKPENLSVKEAQEVLTQASAQKEAVEKGAEYARSPQETAEVHGPVPSFPGEGAGEVPAAVSGERVQPQAEGRLPGTTEGPVLLKPEKTRTLREIWDEWNERDTAVVSELADEVEFAISEGKAPESLKPVVEAYRAAVREDFEMAGRGEVDPAADALVAAIGREVGAPKEAPVTPKPAVSPQPDVDLSAIEKATTEAELDAATGKAYGLAEDSPQMRRVIAAAKKRQSELTAEKPAEPAAPVAARAAAEVPAPAETKTAETVTDPSRRQEIKNSIAEGELILQSGRTLTGRKMTPAELDAVRRSVESAKAKLETPKPAKEEPNATSQQVDLQQMLTASKRAQESLAADRSRLAALQKEKAELEAQLMRVAPKAESAKEPIAPKESALERELRDADEFTGKASVTAERATVEWATHVQDVVQPLQAKIRKLQSEIGEMQYDANRTKPETRGKYKLTKKAFLEKYGAANMEEANAIYQKKNAEWSDLEKQLETAEQKRKELEVAKEKRSKEWSAAATRAGELRRRVYPKVKEGDVGQEPIPQGPGAPTPATPPAMPPGPAAGTAGALPGAPMPVASSATAPVIPVKALSQIIRDLSSGLSTPIRFGRLTTTKLGGYFKKVQNLIGAKKANDMPIVSHEVGHKLSTVLKPASDPALRAELHALGDPAIPGSRSSWTKNKSAKYRVEEGVAEYVRRWLEDPADAATRAPNMHRFFEAALNANPDLGAIMHQAQSDIRLWRNAPAEARLGSSISTANPTKVRYTLDNLMRDVVDDLQFLRLAVDDAARSGPILPSQNPYTLARNLRGVFGMADRFIRRGVVDFKTKDVLRGTSLEDALKPVAGRIEEFRRWIVAKRAKELQAQGRETGLVPSDVDFVANKYNADPAFQESFAKLKAWNDALLKYSVDSGLISQESATLMRGMNQDYVPFHRIFEVGAGEMPSQSATGTGVGLNVGKPGSLRRLRGSTRDIIDPLETMVKNAYTLITASEKNAINTSLADLSSRQNMGRWVERVATPKEAVRIQLERIREQLEAAGADLTAVPDDIALMFFKPSKQAPFGENIIKVNRGGKLEFYRLDRELFDTFHALDQESSGRLITLLSAPAQLLRSGVTLAPDFAIANMLRDTVSASVISRYTAAPFITTLRGLAALAGKKSIVDEWAASGGRQSIEATFFDRAKLQKFLTEKITKDLTPTERATVYLKSPLTALRLLTGTFEEATRIGEFKAVYDKLVKEGMSPGDARRQAAFEARDLQDFAKGGAQTKIIRRLAAFWNAALQANVRLANAFRHRPLPTIAKGLAFVTIPKIIEQALNWNDDDYWDRPQWERDLFFLVPYGKDDLGHTKFIRIPTPFEIGIIFGTIPGRMMQFAKERNDEAFNGLFATVLKQTVPNPVPQAVLTMIEAAAGRQGYSFWRGRPIVPESLKEDAPELQFTEQTSLTARKVGKALGLSPAKIDYVIQGMAGGIGRQLIHQGTDRAISLITGEPRTAQSQFPGGRFFTTPAGIQSEAVDRFYRALNEARAEVSREKAGLKTTGQQANIKTLERTAREIANLRKRMLESTDDKERQELRLRIVEKAKFALL